MKSLRLAVLALASASVYIAPAYAQQQVTNNAFNPALSLILVGTYTAYENDPEAYRIPGFQLGGEAGLAEEGFSLGHTELTLSANVDDLFYGSSTLAIHEHNDEAELEIEEAWIQTLGLGHGLTIRAGRFFSELGYINTRHEHATAFADDPLVYSALFGGRYNPTGVQLNWIAPTDLFINLGIELTNGKDFPARAQGGGLGATTVFLDIGGDIGFSQSWKLGFSYLNADVAGREGGGHTHGHHSSGAHTHVAAFTGDSVTYGIDFVYKWAPHGNPTRRNFQFQIEYFFRNEDGKIAIEEPGGTEISTLDSVQSGWYAQAVYQFMPQWRIGVRYGQLNADNEGSAPAVLAEAGLDDGGHTPHRISLMIDYAHSEFSRLILQYNHDVSYSNADNQIILQYVMSLGSHGAHVF